MYEPDIFQTTRRFGTVLENVDLDPRTRALDLDSERFTENTRGAYPLEFIGNADPTGIAGTPRAVVFLTADAFGVLPPIARLSREQAAYHFISGYTAKLAGTEVGIKEPKATFSACFGAPFMPRHPGEYAHMLVSRLEQDDVPVWLVNTGWTGGPFGTGERMNIAHTRSMVRAALDGSLASGPHPDRSDLRRGGPDQLPGRAGSLPGSPGDLVRSRMPTTARRASWRGCSPTTSGPTRMGSATASGPPVRSTADGRVTRPCACTDAEPSRIRPMTSARCASGSPRASRPSSAVRE